MLDNINATSNTKRDTVIASPTNAANSSTQQKTENVSLSPKIMAAYREIARRNAIDDYELTAQPIGGVGENSYGSVLKVLLTPKRTLPTLVAVSPLHTVLKIAPTNAARRVHIRAADVYAREVFMYENVFSEFDALATQQTNAQLANTPQMLYSSLESNAEFIIFEDLTNTGFVINSRTNLPTYDLVVYAFRAIAQLHAMSFVLQARQPKRFAALVAQMDDNLFTADMEEVSIEFGKKYVRRTRNLLEADLQRSGEDTPKTREVLQALHKIESNFHKICMDAVNGAAYAPYAVICHGDFWNNNILYKFDSNNKNTVVQAKLIDFQISRYSPPILDLVHYLYCCTEKPLRDAHFHEFMQIYYETLTQIIRDYQLDPEVLYPEVIFKQQLRQFGVYGFCMSAFAVPFFVAQASELPDMNKVSEAICDLSPSSNNTETAISNDVAIVKQQEHAKQNSVNNNNNNNNNNDNNKLHEHTPKTESAANLVEEYDLLTERTLPLFKSRMIGNVLDLQKYEMIEAILKY